MSETADKMSQSPGETAEGASASGRPAARKLALGLLAVGLLIGAFLLGRRTAVPRGGAVGGRTDRAASHGGEPGEKAPAKGTSERPEHGEAGESGNSQGNIARFTPETLADAGIEVQRVSYTSVRSYLQVTGAVEPNLAGLVKITPRVAGKITSLRADIGDNVRAGQVLATMTSIELAQAQAAYLQATTRVAVAWNNLQREQKLARLGAFGRPTVEAARSQATTAQAEVDTTRSEVDVARAAVTEADSQVRALQAALEQARTEVKVTQGRFNRADLLLRAGIVSQQAWEQTQADYQHSQADVEAAQANVAQGQAKLATAQANREAAQVKLAAAKSRSEIATQALAREEAVYQGHYMTSKEMITAEAAWRQAQLEQRAAAANIRLLGGRPGGGNMVTIKTPLGGRVTERLVTLGETVNPDKPLFTVMNLNTVWVQLSLYPKDVPAIRVGQAVTVTSDTAPGRSFSGTVSYVSDLVDPATRTVKVRCVIHNVDDLLKPGTFVRGTIAAGGRTKALAIPKNAVQQLNGQTVAFVPADKPGEFRSRPVEEGAYLGNLVEIRGGLKAGDRVVTKNAFLVKAQAMKSQLGEEDEDKDKGEER